MVNLLTKIVLEWQVACLLAKEFIRALYIKMNVTEIIKCERKREIQTTKTTDFILRVAPYGRPLTF
jgi:hypothetical protein